MQNETTWCFPKIHIFLFTEDESIYTLPFSFHFPFNWKFNLLISYLTFLLSWDDEIRLQKRVHYKWTLNTPVLRRLSNLFTIEISTVHILNIYFYTVLVQKQLCQHWSFSWNPNGRYRRNRTCLDEHTFFKSLSFVFTSCVAAVFDYNSPKCHNNWFRWLFMIRFLIWAA